MSGLELVLALLGAGGLTAIVTAAISGRVAVRTAELSQVAAENTNQIEQQKLELETLKASLAERNIDIARVRQDADADRSRLRSELTEERAAAEAAHRVHDAMHAELLELRAWKAERLARERAQDA